jgi:N-acetyl-anhydromuramyl-L-alanine amidase AmpD
VIVNHRLNSAPFVFTPNVGGRLIPELAVIHYTVSYPARAVIAGFERPASKASAHLVLDLDGKFTQMVAFDRQAWHAGNSEWNGRKGCNAFAIGIEICNPGPVFRNPDGWHDVNMRTWLGQVEHHEPPPKFPKTWTHWAAYSEAQLTALEVVCRELCQEYRIREIVGHSDVSPGRKMDPGPAFPMHRLRAACGLLADDEKPTIAPKLDPLSLPVLDLTIPRTTGPHVRLLQERLVYWMRRVTVDENFGPLTAAAVVDFQKSRGVEADGVVGAETWTLLLKETG